MASARIDIRGHDKFGAWTATNRPCNICGEDGLALRYTSAPKDLKLPDGIDAASTILIKAWQAEPGVGVGDYHGLSFLTHGQGGGFIGVTCGCYASFMRQVAHIEDSMSKGLDF